MESSASCKAIVSRVPAYSVFGLVTVGLGLHTLFFSQLFSVTVRSPRGSQVGGKKEKDLLLLGASGVSPLFASGSDLHQKPGISTAAVFCLDATVCSSLNISRTCLWSLPGTPVLGARYLASEPRCLLSGPLFLSIEVLNIPKASLHWSPRGIAASALLIQSREMGTYSSIFALLVTLMGRIKIPKIFTS